jgi:hypothetical protein
MHFVNAGLESPTQLQLVRPRGHEMCAAEGREEVVQRILVRQVDDAEPHAELGLVAAEQVVGAETEVE